MGLALIFLVANFGDSFKQGIFHRIFFFSFFSFFWAITCNMKECLRVFYFYILNITKFG